MLAIGKRLGLPLVRVSALTSVTRKQADGSGGPGWTVSL